MQHNGPLNPDSNVQVLFVFAFFSVLYFTLYGALALLLAIQMVLSLFLFLTKICHNLSTL